MNRLRSLSCASGLLLTALVYPAIAETSFSSDVPILNEEAASAGIDHSYTGGWEFFVGGGVASLDCNGDRLPDLVIAGGASPAGFYVNESATGEALAFKPLDTGLNAEDLTGVLGAYPLDIDNDRYMDLVLLKLGRNLVLRGGPDCRFEKANREFAYDCGTAWSIPQMLRESGKKHAFPDHARSANIMLDRIASVERHSVTCEPNQLAASPPGEPRLPDAIDAGARLCALFLLFNRTATVGTARLPSPDRQYYREARTLWQMSQVARRGSKHSASQGWQRLTIWGMGKTRRNRFRRRCLIPNNA